MEYISILFYFLFLMFGLFLTIYNFFYAQRAAQASQKLGFGLPRLLKRALDANTAISFVVALVIFVIFIRALFLLRLPTI